MDKCKLKDILPQLKSWCTVNNISVQSVYDVAHGMTLQELVYYLFGVVKQTVDEVVDYQGQFDELKSFVDNYFNNLNVQEEINIKLDEMAEDGTLANLINDVLLTNIERRSWLYGKKVVAYGDSTITVGNSYINQLKNISGAESVVNRGVGGTMMNVGNNNGVSLINSATDLGDFDVVILSYGTNDWQTNRGIPDVITDVYTIIQAVASKNSGAEIVFCLPPYSWHDFGNGTNANLLGSTLEEYVDGICFGLRNAAISCRFVDFYHNSTCSYYNYSTLMRNDSEGIYVHPTDTFATELAGLLSLGIGGGRDYKIWKNVTVNYDLGQAYAGSISGLGYGLYRVLQQDTIYRSVPYPISGGMVLRFTGRASAPFKIIVGNTTYNINSGDFKLVTTDYIATDFYQFGFQTLSESCKISSLCIEVGFYREFDNILPFYGQVQTLANGFRVSFQKDYVVIHSASITTSLSSGDKICDMPDWYFSDQRIIIAYDSGSPHALHPIGISNSKQVFTVDAIESIVIPDQIIHPSNY